MVLENIEDARKFVDYAEELIEILDFDDGEIYDIIVKEYPEISDFDSFKKFFYKFLKDCPNFKIVEGIINDENAEKLWDSIIVENVTEKNKKELSKIYISKVFEYEVKLIKEHFNLELK